ncbi:hypothetical protein ADT71_11490 [Novosphingobium sp. ST904]|nr:hypothetical protein ADT71_11490 [Novosphingobium sp. ST904]
MRLPVGGGPSHVVLPGDDPYPVVGGDAEFAAMCVLVTDLADILPARGLPGTWGFGAGAVRLALVVLFHLLGMGLARLFAPRLILLALLSLGGFAVLRLGGCALLRARAARLVAAGLLPIPLLSTPLFARCLIPRGCFLAGLLGVLLFGALLLLAGFRSIGPGPALGRPISRRPISGRLGNGRTGGKRQSGSPRKPCAIPGHRCFSFSAKGNAGRR